VNYNEQRKLALELFKGDKYTELRQAINDGKCFNSLLPLAEKAGAIEFWDSFVDEWIYKAGCKWSLSEEVLEKAFLKLKNEKWVYYAGYNWNLPKEILTEVFLKLKEDGWVCWAGCKWNPP